MTTLADDDKPVTTEQRDVADKRDAATERQALCANAARFGLRRLHERVCDAAAAPVRMHREATDVEGVAVWSAEDAGDQLAVCLHDEADFVAQARREIAIRLLEPRGWRIDFERAEDRMREGVDFAGT